VRSAEYPERFSPDGLTEQIIDALLPLVWPRYPLPHPPAAERARPSVCHHRVSGGGGLNPRDVHDTRPGGPNRQERAHRAGAPESLTKAIEEIGMLQVHTCVSVHCDQCGNSPDGPGFDAYWPTENAALDAAVAGGWLVGPGGRLWCSACGPVLTCEAHGHEFSQ
jgi:hypothetical protein